MNRNIAAAVNQGDIDFHNAFFTNARAKLSDDHIWFSVVMRPTPSSFTRVQVTLGTGNSWGLWAGQLLLTGSTVHVGCGQVNFYSRVVLG